ncbi:hypothetical protein LOTGIDRAFT_182228 [Lottia gigantea]|uniref:Aminopeptidase P N-terminal domain-containing protein n=1 Tax=Lottia gigantea TaxID=225164 RepID=V4AAL7_LOTGI|nr:hypothetical protein LOTGIDRAFT_182228 [Lottia gigantea]ESO93817.1 hypothetical protein LOTGIDRAFT_182228 [Lottia gigantea]
MLKNMPRLTRLLLRLPKTNNYNIHQPKILVCRHFGQPVALTHPHLLNDGEVTPGITKLEYLTRRVNLVDKAINLYKQVQVSNHIFIIPGAVKSYMTNDIPYPFHQQTDFLYLCGFQEPGSVLILESAKGKANNHTSTLFVPEKNPDKELWDGPRSGKDGALTVTGVDSTHNISDLEKYLYDFSKFNPGFVLWYRFDKPSNVTVHNAICHEFMIEPKYRSLEDPTRLCQQLRSIKSPAEIDLMHKSAEISSEAFIDVMKFSKPGVNESALYAKMDFECRIREAEILAYPPVVAGGNRANIIHYINNDQIINDEELVLMDAGCEYHGYASDITRTWPVSGKFTLAQKQLYNAVLNIQLSCIQLCTVQFSLDQIYHAMLTLIGVQLQHIGLLDSQLKSTQLMKAAKEYCPHHVSHYLGMDVHDTGEISRSINLQPGMIVTVEPGIYINKKNKTVPYEFRGIGIRIEDDVLVTDSKPIVLTDGCPKTVDDIESIMASN